MRFLRRDFVFNTACQVELTDVVFIERSPEDLIMASSEDHVVSGESGWHHL